jgi:hypothetical protein
MGTDRYGFGGYTFGYRSRNSPMVFEISSQSGIRSFCGVMEFIAPPNIVGVPSWMMEHLGIQRGQKVQIRKVTLHKGIFVQLQPHTNEFSIVSDVKATLEWVLRRFVALCVGDTIQIEHDGIICKFNVLKCIPDRAIAITDQDVSVDIVSPLDGSKIHDPISERESQLKEIEALEKQMKVNKESATVGSMPLEGERGVHYELCKNCFQKIPIVQISMHELRCARINWYCEPCNIVVLKTDKEKHEQEYHSEYTCEWCGDTMEKRKIINHKKNACPYRNVACQYCTLTMHYKKLFLHERSCGAVTEICLQCNARYPRFEMSTHKTSCTGVTLPSSPLKTPFYVPKYKDTYNNHQNKDDLMICEKCQKTFSSFEDFQIHVFTVHIVDDMPIAKETKPESPKKETVNETSVQPEPNEENVTMTEVPRSSKRTNEDLANTSLGDSDYT